MRKNWTLKDFLTLSKLVYKNILFFYLKAVKPHTLQEEENEYQLQILFSLVVEAVRTCVVQQKRNSDEALHKVSKL